MTEDDLLESARRLPVPPTAAAEEYQRRSEALAAEITRRMMGREDVVHLVGKDNLEMMQNNHRNHARFMASLLGSYNPEVLVGTVLWVFRAYRAHGFTLAYWPAQLDTWVLVLREELSPDTFRSVYPFYDWLIVNQAAFATLSEHLPPSGAPMH